jgi:hypothetical protein
MSSNSLSGRAASTALPNVGKTFGAVSKKSVRRDKETVSAASQAKSGKIVNAGLRPGL